MDDTDPLMSIGAFARQVGLAPSALRFYDDCAVLHPAFVDDATGYRYYAASQEARAVLVRRLREAGVPLTDASVVLDGSPEDARALLAEHAGRARQAALSARSAIEEILRDLPGGRHRTMARVGGAELAGAIRQVAPAVAADPVRGEFPVLGCVLIEIDGEELRLAATDRYRLAVRTLRSGSAEGAPCRVAVAVEDMEEVSSWAMRLPEVGVEVDREGTRLRGGGEVRALATAGVEFPDYRTMLEELPAFRHRIITGRAALLGALSGGGAVTLRAEEQRLTLTRGDAVTGELAAITTGPPLRIAFDPDVLFRALDAGVGPDVLLEIASPVQPVVVRSADQGGFTTLVMPVRA
ncbi:MerR family transcriptional regulator [Actinomadura sp. DC4]|uniref:DNA polymerase III subunit beta family protein n=1 Tax=Actinomadura sp. DC4 TaxID=3055069 RepID=UPI0025B1C90C|nr:MerR family transcriptional regulator [Actinomadura sp. DC4]MDN3354285.1 MerR family transcriptional regulator [Actinomadura sp. DC4]